MDTTKYAHPWTQDQALTDDGYDANRCQKYRNNPDNQERASFLIATPQTGIDSILATFSLMGLGFAVVRPVADIRAAVEQAGFEFKGVKGAE